MADIDLVLSRIAADPGFAAQLRTDPRSTLSSYQLSDADFARVERAVSDVPASTSTSNSNPASGVSSLFAPAATEPAAAEPVVATTLGAALPPRWHRRPWQGALGAALAVGAMVGFGLGHASSPADAPPSSTSTATAMVSAAALTPVAYSACPADAGASHLGDFHRGDQIWVVGRDTTGRWLQVRDPAGDRVWVARSAVTAADTDRLAVVACDLPGPASPAATAIDGSPIPGTDPAPAGDPRATTSITTSTATTSTISGGGPTTTPVPTRPPGPGSPGDPTSTTTTPPVIPPVTTSSPGPTVPADHAGPLMEKVGGNPPDIWERYPAAGGRCVSQTSATVSASVTDPSGVATVQVDWIVAGAGGAHGTASTSRSGSTWSATVGPVEWKAGAVPANGADLTVTVHALDGAGNTSTATTTLHLHSAQECIG